MDHDPGAERLRRQYLECGEVVIDIRDLDGLISAAQGMDFDMRVAHRTFSSKELAVVAGSEFRLLPEHRAEPRMIEASVSYLIDRLHSNPGQDLYDIYDHLATNPNYDQTKFSLIPREGKAPMLAYEFDADLVAGITVDDLTDGTNPHDYSPGVITMRIRYENEPAGPAFAADLVSALRLWGDLHDAVASPNRGKHADRLDQPVTITIGPFQPTDDMLAVHEVLMIYQQNYSETDQTWPELDLPSIDVQLVVERLAGFDEARLREAIATLLAESRLTYGQTGEMPSITGQRILEALERIGPA